MINETTKWQQTWLPQKNSQENSRQADNREANRSSISSYLNDEDEMKCLPVVTLKQVTLTYKQQLIFNDFNLTIYPGDKLALIGKSGVGKSSLIKMICGFERGFSGTVINNAQRIGYVFQEPRLLPWLTVGQNIDEVLKAQGLSKYLRDKRLKQLLAQVELSAHQQHFPHQLSGGMAQRASLARAFAAKPDLLILDEPFSALDKQSVTELTLLLKSFLTEEITMLYISHDIEQVVGVTNISLLLKPANQHIYYRMATKAERDNFIHNIYPSEVKS
jgi:ABC-type nitrate/sulfonate/bicarbonate transport system ATPase subunit